MRHPLPTVAPKPPPENRATQEETDAFGNALAAHELAIKKCHEAAARVLPERVRLYISIGVDTGGHMTDIHVVGATVEAPQFFECLGAVVEDVTLPPRDKATGPDYIVYPFSFIT